MRARRACCLFMRWRPSITMVALARAAVWAMFLPTAYASLLLASMGHGPPLRLVVQMALAIAALVVTRPLLSTERARAEFAPLALRPWFLASAIGSMASGIMLARAAEAFAHFHVLARDAIGLAVLAIPFFIAGVGVLRMRSWGIILGALAALASIPIVAWIRDPIFAAPVLLTSIPAALMGALVAIARLRQPAPIVQHRVAADVRVAIEEEEADFDFVSTSAPATPTRSSIACTRR